MRVFGIVMAAILGIVVLVAGGFAYRYYTAEVRGVVSAEEQIESSSSRITNYNHFFDLCASVQTKEGKIKAQQELLDTAEEDKARIRQNIASLKGVRMQNIRQYNQDARKQYTQARFQSSKLPYQLDPNDMSTNCNVE